MSLYFQFCILHFLSKIQKFNMTPILGEENFFGKLERTVTLDTLWVKNILMKLLYLTQLRRYKQFCVLLVKKIVNALLIIQ